MPLSTLLFHSFTEYFLSIYDVLLFTLCQDCAGWWGCNREQDSKIAWKQHSEFTLYFVGEPLTYIDPHGIITSTVRILSSHWSIISQNSSMVASLVRNAPKSAHSVSTCIMNSCSVLTPRTLGLLERDPFSAWPTRKRSWFCGLPSAPVRTLWYAWLASFLAPFNPCLWFIFLFACYIIPFLKLISISCQCVMLLICEIFHQKIRTCLVTNKKKINKTENSRRNNLCCM